MSVVPPTCAYFGIAQSSLPSRQTPSFTAALKAPWCSSPATFHFNRGAFQGKLGLSLSYEKDTVDQAEIQGHRSPGVQRGRTIISVIL